MESDFFNYNKAGLKINICVCVWKDWKKER